VKKLILLLLSITIFSSCKTETKSLIDVEENIMEKSNLKKTITFPSQDGLTITADIYKVDNNPITILLCHQAGFSRGEYKNTALELNKLGYSVMAIDQRSGEISNNVVNETAKRAKDKNLPSEYIDARPDIASAIDYVYNTNGNTAILLVGSSYSATLSLLIGDENKKVKAIAAFSPGEYFKDIDVKESIKNLKKPTFVTASLSETEALKLLVSKMDNNNLTHYKPTETGIHGSRALWKSTKGTKGYWTAFKAFLSTI